MLKARTKYQKPDLKKIALVASEAILSACKTSGGNVTASYCGDTCHKWYWHGHNTALCKNAGS